MFIKEIYLSNFKLRLQIPLQTYLIIKFTNITIKVVIYALEYTSYAVSLNRVKFPCAFDKKMITLIMLPRICLTIKTRTLPPS